MGGICTGKSMARQPQNIRYHNLQPSEVLNQKPIESKQLIQNTIFQQKQQIQQTSHEQSEENKSQTNTSCCFTKCQLDQDNFIQLPCKHYYHKECADKIEVCCMCKAAVPIYESNRITIINFKEQLKEIKEKYSDTMQIVKCQNNLCNFFFIFQEKLEFSNSYQYFCDLCDQKYGYSQDIIRKIQVQEKIKEEEAKKKNCFGCEKSFELADQIVLQCQHKFHEQCLFDFLGNSLKFKCKCEVRIDRSLISSQMRDKIFESQIYQIGQQPKNHIQYCKLNQNCTFIYVDDENNGNEFCPMCSSQNSINQPNSMMIKQKSSFHDPKICYSCKSPLFTFFIEINKCNHKYHLLCAQQLIKDGKINQIQCICGRELNEQTKQNMMIQCIKCEKYGDSLILLDCMHYIHYNCLDQYADEFSDFQCSECQFSIATCLEQQSLKLIKEKLSKIQEDKLQQQWLDPNFCIGCFRNGNNLILLQCKHSYHEDCLQKMIKHKEKCADRTVNCKCGVQVKDQNQYIPRHPVNY